MTSLEHIALWTEKEPCKAFPMFLLHKVKGDHAVRTGEGFSVTKETGYDKKAATT